MPRLPSSTPSVTKTTIGMISPPILYLPSEMNSTMACPNIEGDDKQVNSHSDKIQNCRAPELGAHGQTSILLETTIIKRDLPEYPCSSGRWHLERKEMLLNLSHSVSICVTRAGLTQRKDKDKTHKAL